MHLMRKLFALTLLWIAGDFQTADDIERRA